MAEYTENLGLLKKNPVADAKDTFNIQTMLNDNWDKVDKACARMAKISTGGYAGTSNSETATVELKFDAQPKVVFLRGFSRAQQCYWSGFIINGSPAMVIDNLTETSGTRRLIGATWGEKSLTLTGASNIISALYDDGTPATYFYVALF